MILNQNQFSARSKFFRQTFSFFLFIYPLGVDSNGNVMWIQNINTGKMLNKFHRGHKCLYKPNPNQVVFSKLDLSKFIETKIKAYLGFCKDQYQRNQTVIFFFQKIDF